MVASAIAASLRRPRYELFPMKGIDEQFGHLPAEATVTVTVSPTRGMEPSLRLVGQLATRGHRVAPHVAARMVGSRSQLDETLTRLVAHGVEDILVVAGDASEPAGPYEGAADLLEDMHGLGHRFGNVGVTGYPEPHPFIPDDVLVAAMQRKLPYATYIVSQMCFDGDDVRRWIDAVRSRGVDLPIFVGVPGAVDMRRLARIAVRVGVGESARFLRKQGRRTATRLVVGYRPDPLIEGLADLLDRPDGVTGWHVYTFNEVERTERWRQRLLDTDARRSP